MLFCTPAPAGSSSRSWLAGVLPFSTRSRARKCAGAAHPRTPAIPEDRRAIMPNHLSLSQPRLLPRHPFLKSVPQAAHQPSSLFPILYSLNPPLCGEQFALMACGYAFLLHTQPGPEVCRGRTPSHTCNPGRPPGNQPDFLSPLTASPPPTPPLSKIRAAMRHTKPLHSSLFSIHLTRPSAGSSSRSWPAGELSFSTRSRARQIK